ncbi:trifunctional serine/threonine-protein kinase/ATP-binding protein/sensor histidine kinase [Paraliomyxa miuraensis]|uniref:trifunctional serine/threonine-protein kinase/ATP-binding protein/sensor histidine kinase n=1 Tax=Paraliomyxa miuraensis TaxID=376150 RepID=UPI0022556C07|nr:trifunctional serine/threonine-protein kinase/ATP-binding protein/sensor histidine kinase [Paraliomyxa miuraensis]MCX4240621.1 AAA family ATPase [Paraliomyxa miuraensis]
MEFPNYVLGKTLYAGHHTVVCSATSETSGAAVALKYPNTEYPSLSEVLRYRHEFEVLTRLEGPWVIRALSLERVGNRLVLVTEDFGGVTLREYFGAREPTLERFLQLAIGLARALAFIHERGVVHKDINPTNVLVDPRSGEVKLIDFGISTMLSREARDLRHPERIEGTLEYMSPEQTGRMNRTQDYRSDFYSMGATLHALAQGAPPFESEDLLELIHHHIAKEPEPLHGEVPWIPPSVSQIVTKLLAKSAEHRYQSARGLLHDLEHCLAQLREHGTVAPFVLGTRDASPRFEVPQTLYGRSEELSLLLGAFDRVARGGSELLLLAGYSGIGKSSLVNEVHKPIAARGGHFIKGKHDQYKRDVPYSAITQAFEGMVEAILMEPPQHVEHWRARIQEALGANGKVVVDIVPSLELLIGPPAPLSPLSATEARNRFTATFRAFVRALARPGHPLVLFLDDMQWANRSSLGLLESLLVDADTPGLLVIAAYRDNEVDAAHPFTLAVQEIERSATTVDRIELGPLALPDVTALVGATVRGSDDVALPLATLLHRRTAGNPFFLVQLLRTLHEDGLFSLDDHGRWTWDMPQILALGLTDDVVDLMASRLTRLPESTKALLRLASCIGNQFDLGVLARASGRPLRDVAASLWPTLEDGLVLPLTNDYAVLLGSGLSASTGLAHEELHEQVERAVRDGDLRVVYRFLHDRVQQAAYALIPPEERKVTHLELGRLLLGDGIADPLSDKIFDIVSHLNLGIELVTDSEERFRIARLNHRAAQRARAATAYRTAVSHYAIAMDLLGSEVWSLDDRLALELHRERAECEYIIGNFSRADEIAAIASARSKTPLDKAAIHSMRVQLYMSEGASFVRATEIAIEALGLLGYAIPATEDERKAAVDREIARLDRLMEGREIAELEGHFAMTDPTRRAAMDLMMVGWSAAYLARDLTVSSLMAYLMVTTSLEHGHTTISPFGYVIYGLMQGLEGDYPRGYQFGRLAMRLNQLYPDAGITAKAGNIFAHTLNAYFNPLETNLQYYATTIEVAPQVDEFLFVVWAILFTMFTKTMKGDPLPDVFETSTKYLDFVLQSKNRDIIGAYRMHRQMVRALQGLTRERDSLDEDGGFSEAEGLAEYDRDQFHSGKLWHGVFRTGVHVVFNEYRAALESARLTEEVIPFDIGMVVTTNHYFYQSLALAAIYDEQDEAERERSMELLASNLGKLSGWAETAPMNFAHRRDLVAAEIARCRGDAEAAARLYDSSIDGARTQGAMHDEAVAAEAAARFHLARGLVRIARLYMSDACYCYTRWGADGKVADLKARHESLLVAEGVLGVTAPKEHSSGRNAATLAATVDLGSMMKAAQVISGEIEKQALVDQLMRITIENAGARHGWLTLDGPEGVTIIASVSIDSEEPVRLESTPLERAPEPLPAIVRYVIKTREPLVLHDAARHGPFESDPRLRERECKSIVAVPLLRQGQLTGVLYLENELVEDAFTPERVEVLKLLAAQAAVSLENARLYEELEARVAERTRALAKTNRSLQESLDQLHRAQRQLSNASHRAGMAEVATSVLHNIGNVLNSVNVSCRVVMDSIRESRSGGVAKAAALIAAQQDLGAFFTRDERGKRLPEYLSRLAEAIGAERSANITKLQSLEKNIEHIRAIVSMQQEHASFSGVIESLSLPELVEEAIALDSEANEHLPVEIVREVDDLPVVETNRHKMLQMITNLLSNARHAVRDVEDERRCIIVRILKRDERWVAIEVEDFGSGIASENLIKIFNYGFSTKRDGHGFGLHSSSCHAIEMGGKLTVHSDGPGKGAVFTLLLPLLGGSRPSRA